MARKPQRRKPRHARAARPTRRADPSASASSTPSWRCLPKSRSSRSASPRSPSAPAFRSPSCAANSARRFAILAAHVKEIDRAVLAGDRCRHGRGAAARAAVRRADAPDRSAGAAQGRRALADALGRAQSRPRVRAQRAGGALAAMDADRRRHRRRRPARHGPRAGACAAVRLGAAHLGRRRRSRSRPHHGGARPRARARTALVRPARRSLPDSACACRLRSRRRRADDIDEETAAV